MTTETLIDTPCAAPAPAARPAAPPDDGVARVGYACAGGVLDAAAVQALRASLEAAFAAPVEGAKAPPECGRVLGDLFVWPALYPQLFTAPVFAALARLLGDDLVLLPEHSAHREGYGGWHKDTDMFERAGLMHHWSDDYAIYQCGIYLQDNTPEFGGGLSVVPGSHRVPRPRATLVDAAQREQWYAAQQREPIASRAGDLIVFDTRLDHRATPRADAAGAPGRPPKLALFFMAARNNRHAALYTDFIHRRPDYTYLRTYRIPAEMQTLAAAHGMRFVS